MEITKEQIEKRLEALKADYQQAVANVHAIGGAIQDCEHWLEQLAKEVDTPVEE
jgi:hypothetical protein